MLLILFVVSIFWGAWLLFMVQPMVAKLVLPLLGGAPAVWNTSMVFFQGALLLGYLYAHLLGKLAPRRQVQVHAGVLVAGALMLPIGLPSSASEVALWAGSGGAPWLAVVWLLGLSVGVPFFVISSAGPLLQRWFARTDHPTARDPYFLYAASNAGSMLALVAYPLVIEPAVSLAPQRWWWSAGYGAFAVLAVACGVMMLRRSAAVGTGAVEAATTATAERSAAPEAIGWRLRVRWVLLALVPSSLMLGCTQYLTSDVGSFPLMWVIPLAVYLLTFILVFSSIGWWSWQVGRWLVPAAAAGVGLLLIAEPRQPMGWVMAGHIGALLVMSLACHGRLASIKPHPSRLTEFYLLMSVGGVLGGLTNSLLGPMLFNWVAEYPLMVALGCVLAGPSVGWSRRWSTGTWAGQLNILAPVVVLLTYVAIKHEWVSLDGALGWTVSWMIPRPTDVVDWAGPTPWQIREGLAMALPVVMTLVWWCFPIRLGLCILMLGLVPWVNFKTSTTLLLQERTFFGVHRVFAEDYEMADGRLEPLHRLWHGRTDHGAQFLNKPYAEEPIGYYTIGSPLSDIFEVMRDRRGPAPMRWAVTGLGAGALTAYALKGDELTFYEIDPKVDRVARDERYFTYLRDTAARGVKLNATVIGDARLTLNGAADGGYDVLVLDAFTSDSVPKHLLTVEALEMYKRKLRPDGLLMIHISNWYLQLEPVLHLGAREVGMVSMYKADSLARAQERLNGAATDWVVMGKDEAALTGLLGREWMVTTDRPRDWKREDNPGAPKLDAKPLLTRPWTDDYSDIWSVLKLGKR